MALIKSQLVLTDGMTGPLKSINKAMNIVLNSFEAMQDASGRAIDTASIQEAREELARASAALDQLEDHTNKSTDTFSRLAKAIGLVMIARKALDTIKTGIDYASDLAEVQNVVDVTFGSATEAINSWSKECLAAYGMNEVSAKRYAGTLGAMLKSSGLAGDAIVDMSKDMVGLAGDMASFYNLDLETAFEKIRSGISGETEPLKQLGINMSVANLEAYALSQGITTAYNEMSQAEQVMLRYNYLMSTTADAQGDFARTQDSYANQTRLLSESWLEFTGIMAEQLLPVLTTIVSWLNNIVAFLTENADMVSAVLVGLATTVGILAVAWVVHAAAQWLAVAANQALIVSLLSNPILWIAIIIGVLVAAMYRWIQSIGGVKNAWEICKLALIVGWNAVKLAFFTGVYWVIDLVDKLKLCWQKAGVAIANFMGDMKVSVLTILQNMINGAIDIINKFIGVLNKIPGVSIDAIEHVTFATTAAAENEAAKSARATDLAAYESELASAKAGRDAHIDSLKAELNSSVDALQAAYAQAKADAAADSSAEQTALDSIGADTAGINDSAGSAAASLKETTEDLKYMRDLAEQEAINRFTTAEVKIDMTGMTNRIDSDMDLDGVLNTLTEGFAEALEVAAEGVHE
jgi:phage-related protein-like protein